MHITLTNLSTVAVPFSSTEDKGFAVALEPGEPYEFNDRLVHVASVGDNPSFAEEVEAVLKQLAELFKRLITFWRDHSKSADELGATQVKVSIANRGTNGLRVLLGSNTNEVTVNPGTTYEATAKEYVEIRELGV